MSTSHHHHQDTIDIIESDDEVRFGVNDPPNGRFQAPTFNQNPTFSNDTLPPPCNNHNQRIINEIDEYRMIMTTRANVPIGIKFFGKMFKFTNISNKRTFHKSLVLCITFISYCSLHMGRRPLSIVKNVLNRDCSKIESLTNIGTLNNDQLLSPAYIMIDGMKESTDSMSNSDDLYSEDYNSMSVRKLQTNQSNWCDWAPFDNDATAGQLLGDLDSAFLFSYAIFMFISGYVADRCNLRYFLTGGLLFGGVLLYAFGLAYYLDIHSLSYLIIIQILSGIVQTAGWPSVIACIGNWFDTSSRGSVFGIWNANTYLGNILGAAIAGYFVDPRWGLSFMVPGFITLLSGVMVFLFLVPRPEDVHLSPINCRANQDSNHFKYDHHEEDRRAILNQSEDIEQAYEQTIGDQHNEQQNSTTHRSNNRRKLSRNGGSCVIDDNDDHHGDNDVNNDLIHTRNSEHSPLISPASSAEVVYTGTHNDNNHMNNNNNNINNISTTNIIDQNYSASIWNCFMIPGVIEYSLCLGFAKLVSYTFLYWLPKYIAQNTTNNSEQSAYLSVPFDLGGIVGAIAAGYLSDKLRKSGVICSIMLFFAIPSMFMFEQYAYISNAHNIIFQLIAGVLVNGPYALITTAISADLGSRVKGAKAMATVAAIVDGTGSIGAAVGPLVAGRFQRGTDSDWHNVFVMLMASDLIAILCLTRITLKELGLR